MQVIARAIDFIAAHEGFVPHMYRDTRGYLTFGYGFRPPIESYPWVPSIEEAHEDAARIEDLEHVADRVHLLAQQVQHVRALVIDDRAVGRRRVRPVGVDQRVIVPRGADALAKGDLSTPLVPRSERDELGQPLVYSVRPAAVPLGGVGVPGSGGFLVRAGDERSKVCASPREAQAVAQALRDGWKEYAWPDLITPEQWPKLKEDEKRVKYSEFACHELNLFLQHKDKPFFGELTDFMSSGPLVLLALEKENAIADLRTDL